MTVAATALDPFEANRPVLFGVAYRMLGSATDAEDAVQEAWLRWRGASVEALRSPRSWLVTVVTRLCLDHLRTARVRREQYIGQWLPEPIATALAPAPGPEATVDTAETIDMAMLVVLERLSAVERAAFILHDVFDFGYDELAEMLGKTEGACRQLVHRARQRLAEPRQRFTATSEQRRELTLAFLRAAAEGDMEGLLAILAEDAVLASDGGGKASAALNLVVGRDRIMRFAIGVARKKWPKGARVVLAEVNGGPGVLVYEGERVTSAYVLGCGDGQVRAIWVVRNPDKLRALDVPRLVA